MSIELACFASSIALCERRCSFDIGNETQRKKLKLDKEIRSRAKKSYKLWIDDPFHSSLRFKCINRSENIWSVRVPASKSRTFLVTQTMLDM